MYTLANLKLELDDEEVDVVAAVSIKSVNSSRPPLPHKKVITRHSW
jgi:hypothetical protein